MNVHVVFGESGSGSLKEALRQLNPPYDWKVITFPDLFSIGPIWQLHTEEGFANRIEWLKNNLFQEKESEFSVEDYTISFKNSVQELEAVGNSETVTIWTAENAHDQTGLRYVSHLLQGKEVNLHVINSTEAYECYFNRSSRYHFIPLHLGEINPDKIITFLGDSELFCVLTDRTRLQLIKDWILLSNSKNLLRIWKNDDIKSVGEHYFDKLIIRSAHKLHKGTSFSLIKATRLIGEVLGHLDQVVRDEFLEYRLINLIHGGVFDFQGSFDSMRNYSVKLKV